MSGRLAVVGLGPGNDSQRTPEASQRLAEATDLIGYEPYLDMVQPVLAHQIRHRFDNREETARARLALELAAQGRDVAVVSSGDPGIFAMASAVIEELHRSAGTQLGDVAVTIIAGITAASAAAAVLGAPLGHDFCAISLSDVLKPWAVVARRLEAVAGADFVISMYNPISNHRPWQLGRAAEIIRAHRAGTTPVALARCVGRKDESARIITLAELDPRDVDMSTVVIVGSSTTVRFTDASGRQWMYTPRNYPAG